MANGNGIGERLDTWKEIAAHLRRHERTVIRWEKKKGLPVHRVPGGERQAVFAFTSELDAWLRGGQSAELSGSEPVSDSPSDASEAAPIPKSAFSISPTHSHLRSYALASFVTICVVAFAFFGLRSRATASNGPARVDFTSTSMRVFDDGGQLLWTHEFPGTVEAHQLNDGKTLAELSRIADFRGDGDREVFVAVPFRRGVNPEGLVEMEADCFSSQGQLLWSYVPKEKFKFGERDLQGPWDPAAVFVSSQGGKTRIWLALMHQMWGNSFVVDLDPSTGEENLRFVNTGTIRTLNELVTPRGSFLLVGGFNNEHDSGSLAVLDETRPFAASPQTEGTGHKCETCPKGDPDQYFVFPRSEINKLEEFYEDRIFWIRVAEDQIELGRGRWSTRWMAAVALEQCIS